jgi:nucleotide-binding universal stress UspA family protein
MNALAIVARERPNDIRPTRPREEPRATGAYRRVVVGVDLENGSADLLRRVMRLFPNARITAVHAYDMPYEGTLQRAGVGPDEINRQRGEALAAARARLDAVSEQAGAALGEIVPIVERADAARLLIDQAAAQDADLIVVARRSRTRLASLLLGSVSRCVVEEADRDVLVLRAAASA